MKTTTISYAELHTWGDYKYPREFRDKVRGMLESFDVEMQNLGLLLMGTPANESDSSYGRYYKIRKAEEELNTITPFTITCGTADTWYLNIA